MLRWTSRQPFARLEAEGFFEREGEEGTLVLSGSGERHLRKSAFEQIFSGLRKGGAGYHSDPFDMRESKCCPRPAPW
ncbi:MAG: hypothetical protein R2862_04680 [Thermoanaerobaculia bacterium]